MCRYAALTLGAEDMVARTARRWVFETLSDWALGGVVEDAVLLASELVAALAAPGVTGVRIAVAVTGGHLEMEVLDQEPRMPAQRGDALDQAAVVNGRSLAVVEGLANEWGMAHLAGGRHVWARMAVASTVAVAADCPCHAPEDGQVELASGRRVTVLPPRPVGP